MSNYGEPMIGLKDYVGGGGGGRSIADLILANGQAQADSYLRSADIWRGAIGQATGALSGGLQEYAKQQGDRKVAQAVDMATAPPTTVKTPGFDVEGNPTPDTKTQGPDVHQIISGLPPELRARAQAGIRDFQDYATKSKQSQLEVDKLQQDIQTKQQETQQHARDAVAVGAYHAAGFPDQGDGGLGPDMVLFHQAKEAGMDVSHFEPFLTAAQADFQKVQGDPQKLAAFQQHYAAQRKPILAGLMGQGSAGVQEKFDKKTREIKTLNADNSETTRLVEDEPGQTFTGAPKPDTRSLEVQRADLIKKGDTKGAASLLTQMGQEAAAKRDPGLDAAPTLSPAALHMAADLYAQTATLPPMGMGRAGATVRQAIINDAAARHPEANIAENKAGFGADAASVKKLQQQTDAVSAFEQTASRNAKLLDQTLKSLPDTGTSILNKPVRSIESALGSEKMATFNTLRQSVQNEYARIISNPGLSGTMSDSARKEAETLLSPDATVGQIRAALKALQAEAANRHQSYQDQIDAIHGRLSGGATGTLKPIPPGAQPGGAEQTATGPNGQKLVLRNGKWVPQ